MNSIKLRELKNSHLCQNLETDIINTIVKLFSLSNTKTMKRKKEKSNNILKNSTFQINKNKIENKIILILNKVSCDNIDQLITEYLTNINIKNIKEYEIIQKVIYNKLLKDIDFINNYFTFVYKIFMINKKKLNLYPNYFIQILEYKIKYDYINNEQCSFILPDKFKFLEETTNEINRLNNLRILKYFIDNKFFSESLDDVISNIIINQNKYIPDIQLWFRNKTILNNYLNIIKDKIKYNETNNKLRNKFLLESLINNDNNEQNYNIEMIDTNNINEQSVLNEDMMDIFTIQVKNIIDEYIYIKSIEEIIEFIKDECKTPTNKNNFCKIVLNYYFNNKDSPSSYKQKGSISESLSNNLLKLFDNLIKKKILYKSNLSRGLIKYIENNNFPQNNKIKNLLKYLKSNNITKNIEFIFEKYSMKINKY